MNFIPRLLNKLSSIQFKKYMLKYSKKCGKNPYAAYNWSVIHPEYLSIGDNFSAGTNLRLQCWPDDTKTLKPEFVIGNNVSMICNCQISCANKVIIGDGCLFGDNVFVTDNFHGASTVTELDIPPAKRFVYSKGSVIIGKNCWLGRNVCVMPGVIIGDGCVIGANAVVTHDIPEHCIVAGVPAKVVKKII
jgi:UDP-3-O-[3-hydroxymyristoyl] glucosamine N-acyltransferase